MAEGKHYVDQEQGVSIIDETGLDLSVEDLIDPLMEANVASLQEWSQMGRPKMRYQGNIGRDVFLEDDDLFSQLRIAQLAAAKDDVVSGVLESTEALIFNKVRINSEEEDQEDIWNQLATDINLDLTIREIWREFFTCSQCYVGVYWGSRTMKLKNKKKRSRKKTHRLNVPLGITILDPLKVVPVGTSFFKQDRLVYLADTDESIIFDKVLAGEISDPVISSFMMSRYEVSREDEREIKKQTGRGLDKAYLMNPSNVFRFTATKPDYKRFADVRLRSVFDLLDLKHQLKAMDRAFLIGGSNMIVLVTKGSNEYPAQAGELKALSHQIKRSARTPVIVGDHRLNVEIITPKLDKTLAPERYNSIDSRITSRLYNILSSGNYASGVAADDSVKLFNVISRNLESKREDIGQFLTRTILKQVEKRNSDFFEDPYKITFGPKRIALSTNVGWVQAVLDLYSQGKISQTSMLEEFDFDYDQEKQLRMREKKFDEIFLPPNMNLGGEMDQKTAGRVKGGNNNGGGRNPASDKPSPNDRPSKENEVEEEDRVKEKEQRSK